MKNERKDVIICIRVPKSLKKEMDEIDINWSEYIREVIESKIKVEKMKKTWKKIENIKLNLNV